MPTTTKGTWTPADNDDWDLTIDLAAMANSIDLWTTGRYEKSAANLAGLGSGDYVGQSGLITSPAPGRAMKWSGSAWIELAWLEENPVKVWRATKSTTNNGTTSRVIHSVSTGGEDVPAGAYVNIRVVGVGLYNDAMSAYAQAYIRYATGGSSVTPSSSVVTTGGFRRLYGVSGNVATFDFNCSMIMPSTSPLSVALTAEPGVGANFFTYSDPWSLEIEVIP